MASTWYQFNPSDQQLIENILNAKIMGGELPPEIHGLFPVVDIYGMETPWEIFNNNYPSRNSNFFGFSRIKKLNGKSKRKSGEGVWKSQRNREVKDANGQVIGFVGVYSFLVDKIATHWIMYEYSLASARNLKEGDWVLFKILYNRNARGTVRVLPENNLGTHDVQQQPPSSSSSNWQIGDLSGLDFNIDNATVSMPALLLAHDSLVDPRLVNPSPSSMHDISRRDTSNPSCSDDV